MAGRLLLRLLYRSEWVLPNEGEARMTWKPTCLGRLLGLPLV